MGTPAQLAVRQADGTFLACNLQYDGNTALIPLRRHHASRRRALDLLAGGDLSTLGGRYATRPPSGGDPVLDKPVHSEAIVGSPRPARVCVDDDALYAMRGAATQHLYVHENGRWREEPIVAKWDE